MKNKKLLIAFIVCLLLLTTQVIIFASKNRKKEDLPIKNNLDQFEWLVVKKKPSYDYTVSSNGFYSFFQKGEDQTPFLVISILNSPYFNEVPSFASTVEAIIQYGFDDCYLPQEKQKEYGDESESYGEYIYNKQDTKPVANITVLGKQGLQYKILYNKNVDTKTILSTPCKVDYWVFVPIDNFFEPLLEQGFYLGSDNPNDVVIWFRYKEEKRKLAEEIIQENIKFAF